MKSYSLPIHFEILDNKHEVSSVTLNTFIEAYREIFEELFEQKIEINIGLPEEGGWKDVLAVILVGTGFIGIDNLSILVRGKPSSDLFYEANKHITKFISEEANKTPEEYSRKCIEQKNKIYRQFQDDKCITAFDLDKCPPIPRNNFNLYIKELSEEDSLYCGEAKITVNSPVWKGNKRAWKGEVDILDGNEVAFDFDKDLTGKFWEKIRLNDITSTPGYDVMTAQLIKRPESSKPQYRVIRVLRYNDKEIDSILDEEIISKITSGAIDRIENERDTNPQMDLFNDYHKG